MVSEKPWRSEAILRLILSVFVCCLLGSLGVAAYRFWCNGPHEKLRAFLMLTVSATIFYSVALLVLHKPWELERFTRRFTALLVCFYLGSTLGWFAESVAGKGPIGNPIWRTIIATLCFQGTAMVLTQRFVREHRISWSEAFGFRRDWKMAVLYGVLVAFSFLPFAWLLNQGSSWVLDRFNFKTEVQTAILALKESHAIWERCVIAVITVLLAPVAEEIGFRGILYPAIKQAGFPRLAWLGTSLLFAVIHVNLPSLIPLFLLALALVWLYEHTDNLLAPIAAHATFNALNFCATTFERQIVQFLQSLGIQLSP